MVEMGVGRGREREVLLERIGEVVEIARFHQYLNEVVGVGDQLLHLNVSRRFCHYSANVRSKASVRVPLWCCSVLFGRTLDFL